MGSGVLDTIFSYQRHRCMHAFVSVRGKATFCIFLPEGQKTSLHVVVSVRGIVLEDTHCVPLLAASAIFSLNNWRISEHQNIDFFHLVLVFLPPPHVAEQEDHELQGPTSQSTESKSEFIRFTIKRRLRAP